MLGQVIVRDRPAYDKARASALRCLQQRRKGEHRMSVGKIADTFRGEWALDAEETVKLAAILSKAQ